MFRLRKDCSVMTLRGKHLLIRGTGEALEVNGSFARIWDMASGGPFDAALLAAKMQEEYELSGEEALAEAGKMIRLWSDYGLVEAIPE